MKTIVNKIALTFLMSAYASVSFAQGESAALPFTEKYQEQIMLVVILLALLIIFFSILFLFRMLMGQIQDIRKEILQEKGLWKPEDELSSIDRFWARFENQLTDAVPVEEEEEIEMDHSYDGIRELDNNLPPWWKWLFYVSIVWSVLYMFHFHVMGNGKLMLEEYETEMAEAAVAKEAYLKKAANLVDETNVTFLAGDADLAKGKSIYDLNCAACHRKDGGGEIGPNLTDEYWINGGGIKNIFEVVKYGRPQRGMISWQAQLKPLEMQQVASYIMTLEGTNPDNPKEPEGKVWIKELDETATDSTQIQTDISTDSLSAEL